MTAVVTTARILRRWRHGRDTAVRRPARRNHRRRRARRRDLVILEDRRCLLAVRARDHPPGPGLEIVGERDVPGGEVLLTGTDGVAEQIAGGGPYLGRWLRGRLRG